jgi:hypothetical protein
MGRVIFFTTIDLKEVRFGRSAMKENVSRWIALKVIDSAQGLRPVLKKRTDFPAFAAGL